MSQAGSLGVGGSGRSTTVAVSTFQPNVVLQEFDDFLTNRTSDRNNTKLAWNGLQSSSNLFDGTVDHPGIIVTGTTTDSSGIYLGQSNSANAITLGGGVTSMTWVIQLPTLSDGVNSYNYYCGFADAATLGALSESYVDALYFKYNHALNAGQWTINSTSASVTTTVNTASVVTTSWTSLTIVVNAGNTSASFYVNNVLVGTAITTTLPTTPVCPMSVIYRQAGTLEAMRMDLFYIDIALTTPRPGPTFSQAVVGTGQLIEQYVATPISYQVLNTDAIIGVTSTAAARTITMPASSLVTGQRWTVKDESGGAATNNITVNGNGKNIDGAATYVINTNFGSVDIYYNGSNFFVI